MLDDNTVVLCGQGGAVCLFASDSEEDVIQKVVNNGDDRHVLYVWVQGRRVKQPAS